MPNRNVLTQPRAQLLYAYPLAVLKDQPYYYSRMNELLGRGIVNLVTGQTLANAYSAAGVAYGLPGGFAGDPCTGVQFDGVAGNVTLPLVTAQQTNVSLECRVYLLSAVSQGMAMKVGAILTGYGIGIGGTTLDNTGTQFIAALDNNSWNLSTALLSIKAWHHLVWTFAAANTHTFYVDGSQVAQFTSGAIVLPTTNNYIGSDGVSRFSNLQQTDCAFYNYVLTPTQVANHALLAN